MLVDYAGAMVGDFGVGYGADGFFVVVVKGGICRLRSVSKNALLSLSGVPFGALTVRGKNGGGSSNDGADSGHDCSVEDCVVVGLCTSRLLIPIDEQRDSMATYRFTVRYVNEQSQKEANSHADNGPYPPDKAG